MAQLVLVSSPYFMLDFLVIIACLFKKFTVFFRLPYTRFLVWKGGIFVPGAVRSQSSFPLWCSLLCLFCNVFSLFLSLCFILLVLVLSLYKSCAGFFLIMTHLQVQQVLPDQLFIEGCSGDLGPVLLPQLPSRAGWARVPFPPPQVSSAAHSFLQVCLVQWLSLYFFMPSEAWCSRCVSLRMWPLLWSLWPIASEGLPAPLDLPAPPSCLLQETNTCLLFHWL